MGQESCRDVLVSWSFFFSVAVRDMCHFSVNEKFHRRMVLVKQVVVVRMVLVKQVVVCPYSLSEASGSLSV